MAKRPPQTENLEERAQIDISEIMTGEELNPALAQLFSELGVDGSGKVTVYISKLNEETGKEARVWQGPPDDYDLMATAKRFGSGDYRVKLYTPTERGNPGQRANQIIPILLDPSEDARIVAMRKGEIPSAAIAPQPTQGITAENLIAAVKAALPAPVDAFAMVERMAKTVQMMMPPQPTGGGMSTVMESLKLAQAFMAMQQPRDETTRGEKPADVAMNRGIMLVESMIRKHLEGTPMPANPGGQPNPQPIVENNDPTLTPDQQQQLNELRGTIQIALHKAKQNANPELFADFVYDDISDEMLVELGSNPNWFAILTSNVPECAHHQPWFQKVRDALVAAAVEDGVLTAEGKLRTVDDSNGATNKGNDSVAGGGTPE